MIDLFFRITNRLFALFMDYLGRTLRDSRRLDFNNTVRKRLLVVRQGGFGDLLFISGITAELKRQHPFLSIDLMCHPRYQGAFHRTTSIDRLLDHRWTSLLHLLDYDYFIFLDGVVECDPEATTRNIYDLFSEKYFGIRVAENAKIPSLEIDPTQLSGFHKKLPALRSNAINIGVQLFANSPVRTPSLEFWRRMVAALLNKIPNARVFLLVEAGHAPQAEFLAGNLNTESQAEKVFSAAGIAADVAQLATLVSMMDCIIAPDSSVIHLSAAFRLPAIGVYGPFPSALRIRSYSQAIAINAPAACAPCFTHGHWPCHQAKAAGVINSPCFDLIPEAMIEETIERLLTKLVNPIHERSGLGAPCPICETRAPAIDVVDFNKNCEERNGHYLPVSGEGVFYHLCPVCGFCFAPRLCAWSKDDFAKRIYNDGYIVVDPEYSGSRSEGNAHRVLQLFGEGHGRTHLDYGSGSGRLSDILGAHGWHSSAYDPYQHGSQLPHERGSIDLITAFEVFEHAPSPQKMFSELSSFCRPEGAIVASTLVSDGQLHPHQRMDWWYASPRNGHICLFSSRSLAQLAESHDFKVGHLSSSLHLFVRRSVAWPIAVPQKHNQ